MAKNYKYLWTWRGQNTDYYYKLEMTPSDLTALSSPTTYNQSPNSIIGLDYMYEFDKYKLGLLNSNLDITFKTDFLSSTLKQELFNPFTNFIDGDALTYVQTNKTTTISFSTGNLFKVYYSIDNITFTTLFAGTQTSGIESDYDLNTKELKISCEDLTKTVLNAITIDNFSDIWDYNSSMNVAEVIDFRVDNIISDSRQGVNSSVFDRGFYGWATTISNYNSFLELLIDKVATAIYRTSTSATFKLIDLTYSNVVTNRLWDQDANTITTNSAILSDSSVYLIHHVSKYSYSVRATADDIEGNSVGGVFYVWKESYKTVYDLYIDLLQNLGLVAYPFHYGTAFYTYHSTLYLDNTTMITPNLNHLSNIKFQPQYEVLKSVSSQLIENAEKNVSEVKTEKPFSRNDNSFTIPIVVHNLPLALEKSNVWYYISLTDYHTHTNKFQYTSLLNQGIYDTRPDRMERISDNMNIAIMNDNSVKANDIKAYTQPTSDLMWSNWNEDPMDIGAWQSNYGLPKIISDTLLTIYGSTSNATIEADVILSEFNYTYGGIYYNTLYNPFLAKYSINPTSLDSDLTGFKTKFYPIKLSADLMNDTANVTLLGGD